MRSMFHQMPYITAPSQFIRPSTVSDYIVVYIVYICTLAEKVWTERRYLSDKRLRTTTKDEKVEFYNLAATLSVAVSCRRLFNEFSDKRKLKTWSSLVGS